MTAVVSPAAGARSANATAWHGLNQPRPDEHGKLTLALRFHKPGLFVGSHAAGPATVTIPLGALARGRYGVIVVPTHPIRT